MAADSLAEMRARRRAGAAMAAMTPMIATTMSSSMSVNPFSRTHTSLDGQAYTEAPRCYGGKVPKKEEPSMAKKAAPVSAITLLMADHKKVRGLLAALEKTTERSAERRTKLLQQIEDEFNVHATIEEEIFYPAYRDAVKKKDDRVLYQ